MSLLEKLSEGIVLETAAEKAEMLIERWEGTGLLDGISDRRDQANIAQLLENQTIALLREANSMAVGAIEGYASIAIPLIRRVFGEVIAQDLVSVQSLSQPSGLIFFLDFTKGDAQTGRPDESGVSLYGGGVVASEVSRGVDIGPGANDETSFYNLADDSYSNALGASTTFEDADLTLAADAIDLDGSPTDAQLKLIRHDADLLGLEDVHAVVCDLLLSNVGGDIDQVFEDALQSFRLDDISLIADFAGTGTPRQVRRLTKIVRDYDTPANDYLRLVFVVPSDSGAASLTSGDTVGTTSTTTAEDLSATFKIYDNLTTSTALGSLVGASSWGLEGNPNMAEIDIRLDSIDIKTTTKKLKTKWTPELQQDLAAYHNLDVEAELTGILADQMTLEIDQEILNDLIHGATAGVVYWSRRPGKFLDYSTGAPISSSANEALLGADFTGTVSEWYETLTHAVNEVSATIMRKTRNGGATFLVCGPEVANIFENTAAYRSSVVHDQTKGGSLEKGMDVVGSLNKKFDVYVNSYFPRNVILVGRKGTGDFDTGYVYAPYVPFLKFQTIPDPDDFTPRTAVMSRYGKRMVRPDLYGLVIVTDLGG